MLLILSFILVCTPSLASPYHYKDYKEMLRQAIITNPNIDDNSQHLMTYLEDDYYDERTEEVLITPNCPFFAPIIYYNRDPNARLVEVANSQGDIIMIYKLKRDEVWFSYHWRWGTNADNQAEFKNISVSVKVNDEKLNDKDSLRYLQDICNKL